MQNMVENEETLSVDDRRCLRSWFRQALAQVEAQEATNKFIEGRLSLNGNAHRQPVTRRRARRISARMKKVGVLV